MEWIQAEFPMVKNNDSENDTTPFLNRFEGPEKF